MNQLANKYLTSKQKIKCMKPMTVSFKDGVKKSSENCDDGNSIDGDGCTKTCIVEVGFICSGGSQFGKDFCEEICGDGRRVGKE